MTCITTISYFVLVNGRPYDLITPTRGIRKGDPLSLCLFIICAEGCSLLSRAENNNEITGHATSKGVTRLSHLFFAYESLLFCRASVLDWLKIQDMLNIYEQALGQQLNRGKTSP
jgi:hypothetical protein